MMAQKPSSQQRQTVQEESKISEQRQESPSRSPSKSNKIQPESDGFLVPEATNFMVLARRTQFGRSVQRKVNSAMGEESKSAGDQSKPRSQTEQTKTTPGLTRIQSVDEGIRGNRSIKIRKTDDRAEYRKQLYKAFELCQRDYLSRLKTRGRNMDPLEKNLTSESPIESHKTVDPRPPKLDSRLHKMVKFGGAIKTQKTRYFLIDEANLVYYGKETDSVALGIKPLGGSRANFQTKENAQSQRHSKWVEADKAFRVVITLKGKENKPCYVYSNDAHFCKALVVKVKCVASPPILQQLTEHTPVVSRYYRMSQFKSFWSYSREVHQEKASKISAFQIFGKKLLDVAGQNWQRNRRLLKGTNDMVESKLNVRRNESGKLTSTFKTGKIKPSGRGNVDGIISLNLLHRMQQLTHMIRSRRQFRSDAIQYEINEVHRREVYGTSCQYPIIEGQLNNARGLPLPNKKPAPQQITNEQNARISFEPHSPEAMLIENLNSVEERNAKLQADKFIKRIDLNQVSMIATDLESFFMQGEPKEENVPFKVKIFGRCTSPHLERTEGTNHCAEFAGLAPLRKDPQSFKTLKVVVTQVEFPVEFIKRHNKKGFVRVKLIQGLSVNDEHTSVDENFKMDPLRQFGSMSEDFRLNVQNIDQHVASNGQNSMISVPLPKPVSFTIRPLLMPNMEQFTFQIIFYANVCPIPSVIKDYMAETVYSSPTQKPSSIEQRGAVTHTSHTLYDEVGSDAKVHAHIRLVDARKESTVIDEREGPRILIGRYVLLDNRTQMQVIEYNDENKTFTLRSVKGNVQKEEIPLNRIKRIERYGVSIYDLNRLPEQIRLSDFEFSCTVSTSNRQFLINLLTKISDMHVRHTFEKRQQLEQKSRIARGNLFCSVVEATNLNKSMTVRKSAGQVVLPYVKITLEQIKQGQDPVILGSQRIQTPVIGAERQNSKAQKELLKAALWTTKDNPTGSVHDLGLFSKNMGEEATDLSGISDVIEKPKASASHGRRGSLLSLNLADAKRPMHNILLHGGSMDAGASLLSLDEKPQNLRVDQVDPEELYIRFQVYNSRRGARTSGQETLLGQSLIQAQRLIDLHEPQQYTQLLLLLPGTIIEKWLGEDEIMSEDKMFAGTLSIKTLFVPDLDTRWNFDMYESRSDIKDPEALAHLNQLLNPLIYDSYHYVVPTVAYNPSQFSNEQYFEKFNAQSRPGILADKSTLRQQMQEIHQDYSRADNLSSDRKYFILKRMVALSLKRQLFSTHEEINDFFMWTDAQFRPMKQDYSASFMQRWLALTIQNSYEARKRLNRFLWQQFISGLIKSGAAGVLPTNFDSDYAPDSSDEEEEGNLNLADQQKAISSHVRRDTYVSSTVKALLRRSSFKAQNPSNTGQGDDAGLRDAIRGTQPNLKTQQVIMETLGRAGITMGNVNLTAGQGFNLKDKELTLFVKRKEWEKDPECNEYKDLHYLVHRGIPDELRVRLWKELLRTRFIQNEQVAEFKKAYKDKYTYNQELSLYNNYLELSQNFDCLAFKQIDEDILQFETMGSTYLQDADTKYERELILRNERNSLRNLLRALILWSKHARIMLDLNDDENDDAKNGADQLQYKDVVLSYGTGFMDMIQRLNAITHSEPECFSILTGLIRSYPTPFSVEKSILLDRCDAMMRYEMTAFKAMVEHSLPHVHAKLRAVGLPVEVLTYRQISSFYATAFHTEIVHRLWDIIIYFFSSKEADQKRRGRWWLLAPAFLILQEKASRICAAVSSEEVIEVYKSGRAMSYDPDWFVEKIKDINQRIFIEGPQKQQNAFSALFFAGEAENKFAAQFEQKRFAYQQKLIKLFDQVQKENQAVDELISQTSFYNLSFKEDVYKGLSDIMPSRIQYVRKRVQDELARRISNRMFSIRESEGENGQSFADVSWVDYTMRATHTNHQNDDSLEEELIEKLPVGKIMIFIHDFTMAKNGFDQESHGGLYDQMDEAHAVKVTYGMIDPSSGIYREKSTSRSVTLEEGPDRTNPIKLTAEFQYDPGHNFIQFELVNSRNGRLVLHKMINLLDLPFNNFSTRRILAQARNSQGNPTPIEQSQMHLNVSFYIEYIKPHDIEISPLQKTLTMSYQRKKPLLVNIFDSSSDQQQMNVSFERLVKSEYSKIKQLLNDDTALDNINEMYNHVDSGAYGKLSMNEFKDIIAIIIPSATETNQQLEQLLEIFKIFTGTQTKNLDRAAQLQYRQDFVKTSARLRSTLHTPAQNQAATDASGDQLEEFSLRHFFITCVLMSHLTVREKLSMLYDVFIKLNGVTDQNSPGVIVELISTIFHRNLYFWQAHELYNQIEQVFTGSIGMVQGAYWTCDYSKLEGWRADVASQAVRNTQYGESNTPEDDEPFQDLNEPNQKNIMNITVEVQEAITRYFSIFGTKMIDFNDDVSPFQSLEELVGKKSAETMLQMANQNREKFKLVLFCTTEGERFNYVLNYHNTRGNLVSAHNSKSQRQGAQPQTSFQTIFERNSNKLFLSGMNKPISKDEFLDKIEEIPFFTNMIRVETFVRDRDPKALVPKQKLQIPIYCTFFANDILFIFSFQTRKNKINQEGQANTVAPDGQSIKFEMNGLCEEDTLADARKRISMALMLANSIDQRQQFRDSSLAMFGDVIGTRDFQVLSTTSKTDPYTGQELKSCQWRLLHTDYLRFHQLGDSERHKDLNNKDQWIMLKLESSRESKLFKALKEKETPHSYDCLALYTHSDQSFDWLPCKIMSRTLGEAFTKLTNVSFNAQCFDYQVAFLHLNQKQDAYTTSRNLFPRSSEEILFSDRYTRELQRSFRQDCYDYVRTTYKQGNQNVSQNIASVRENLQQSARIDFEEEQKAPIQVAQYRNDKSKSNFNSNLLNAASGQGQTSLPVFPSDADEDIADDDDEQTADHNTNYISSTKEKQIKPLTQNNGRKPN